MDETTKRTMTHLYLWAATCLILSGSLAGHTKLAAQDDPFGADPFGAPPSGAVAVPLPSGEETAATPQIEEADPAVLAILESEPRSPQELARAVGYLLDLNRPVQAKTYLQQLLAGAPSAATLVDLQQEFGSALFLRLIRTPQLQPEGEQLGTAVLDAVHEAIRDPNRLAGLIDQLDDPAAVVRRAARGHLRQAGDAATVALIEALGRRESADGTAGLRAALVDQGAMAVEPLLAALQSEHRLLRSRVIDVLGRLPSHKALPFLLVPLLASDDELLLRSARGAWRRLMGRLPSKSEAIVYLQQRIESHRVDQQPVQQRAEETTTVWYWDEAAGGPVSEQVDVETAAAQRAAQLAEQLYRLDESDRAVQRLYFALLLEWAQRRAALDHELPRQPGNPGSQVASAGVNRIEEVLVFANQEGYSAAAVAALDLLGELGTPGLLDSNSGQPAPLAAALQHPDRRIRFAAARAIRRLDPTEAYPGSSYLPETLAYFVRSVGRPRALVIHPRIEQSQTLVGMLSDLGIDAETATSSSRGYQMARGNPDYEFILVSDAVDGPPAGELIQQIRRDPLTATLAIGLMARQQRFADMQRWTELDPLAETFPRPHDPASLAVALRRLSERGAAQTVSHAVRVGQAAAALEHWEHLARNQRTYDFYDLFRHQDAIQQALHRAQHTDQSASALGHLASPAAQRTLVTVASQHQRPLSVRQAAAAAFQAAVRRRGVLLTGTEILLQYQRYNQSAALDQGTQQVLASILDSIEAKARDSGPQ